MADQQGQDRSEQGRVFRLLTRADFDGVISAVLLRERGLIDEIAFAQPNDMQAGRVPVTPDTITSNLPFVEGVHLAFDHHVSEITRVGPRPNLIIDGRAPSAARVIYEHYGGRAGFPEIAEDMIEAVDKADSADYDEMDILAPDRWTMLNFVIDPRTGLHRLKHFAISNDQLMVDLSHYCRRHPVDEIMHIPDVEERVHLYLQHKEQAEHQTRRNARRRDNLMIVDFRREPMIFACNRFMVYALFPEINISLYLSRASRPGVIEIAVGKSILNRTARTDVGHLLLEYGGGGHETAGTCQVPEAEADRVAAELATRIIADG
ncbi:exopolyphosphatase [Roseospira visakhapatnamensis]|uniref:NanoRNase/pAp phosphatase (C-di-AMP/oligoRNAs hydrolase) n=1 Tax=Roseospira visakhapatnamensis TaxID=390880 RepID=A0A7W6RAD2_9PROT|nr:exopolyphosphatase [Roseospira visakhapatnamensis]MBB4264765.1 hypothetical protein [Roseospira visakhapatnamensis]